MNAIKRLFVILTGVLFSLSSLAQNKPVSGNVATADENMPLAGVTVTISGTTKSTLTDSSGNFTIQAAAQQSLEFSYVGYLSKTVPVDTKTAMVVLLTKSTANALQDVVVVGYGIQKRENLTGAVSTVDVAKTFAAKPINNPIKALQGVVPGLTIQYGNGGLTAGASVNIRGIGSINGTGRPLILVDNVQTDDLSLINPQDIESISVLKDAASASIYGARAAFGVVLIKTKSGVANQKATVNYSNYFSWNKPTILPDFSDPVPELTAINNAATRANITPETFGMNLTKLKDGIQNWENNYAKTNTGLEMIKGQDWDVDPDDHRAYFFKVWDPKKEFLNSNTFSQQHNINVSGGTDKLTYYLSGGYSYDGGLLKMNPDVVNKYNFTLGLNAKVNKWLELNAKAMYRNFKYDYPFGYQDYWYYFWRWGAYFPYGTYQGNYFRVNSAYMDAASRANTTDNYERVDFGATVKINPHLNIRAEYTVSRDNALNHEAGGPVQAWDFWSAGDPKLTNIATASQDRAYYATGRLLVNTFNTYATYQNRFGDHNLKVIAGVNAEDDENIGFYSQRLGLLDPSQPELGLTYGTPTIGVANLNTPDSWSQNGHGKQAFAGYFGRINYDYKGKYLLELNGRYDGSSAFSPLDRWDFFPSASVGYRISQENFMDFSRSFLSDLKIRGSYGTLGNQDVGGNYYLRTMNGARANWLDNSGTYVQYITQPSAVANALRWEKVSTVDFGLDARLFNNHIGVTVDWYERNTDGMIQTASVPATFGTSGPHINAGNFRNRGYEIMVDAYYALGKDAAIYATLGFSDGNTVFTKWDNPNESINTALNYLGKTYGEIWGFETAGFFANADEVTKWADQTKLQSGNFKFGPGDIKYKDLNGDGKIDGGKMTKSDHGDLKVIGNTEPRYQFNARVGGSWRNFDVDIFIQGVGKRNFWGIGNTALPMWQSLDILYKNQLDYWTPDNPDAKYPSPYPNNSGGNIAGLKSGTNNFYPTDKYLLNLAYCRLKNITIGYTLSGRLLRKYSVQKFRVFLTGENLAEISNVGAPLDPEITDGYNSYIGRTWPFMRSYAFGVQLSFQ
jgi:TonB-linked SusC/RagA family outer membrane protein